MAEQEVPFWRTKTLSEMSQEEWESLCDGCGRCCLVKLEDEDTGEIFHTDVACALLDLGNCRCKDYQNRHKRVHDCIKLDPENVSALAWLPDSCAYKQLAHGQGLEWWHPLVSGNPETVIQAGISVYGKIVSETSIQEDDLPDHIVEPNHL